MTAYKCKAERMGLISLIEREISREKELTNRNEKLITGLQLRVAELKR